MAPCWYSLQMVILWLIVMPNTFLKNSNKKNVPHLNTLGSVFHFWNSACRCQQWILATNIPKESLANPQCTGQGAPDCNLCSAAGFMKIEPCHVWHIHLTLSSTGWRRTIIRAQHPADSPKWFWDAGWALSDFIGSTPLTWLFCRKKKLSAVLEALSVSLRGRLFF